MLVLICAIVVALPTTFRLTATLLVLELTRAAGEQAKQFSRQARKCFENRTFGKLKTSNNCG
jgi:hypothetical protein